MTSHQEDTGAAPPRSEPDAHGQAALLFTESLLHTLVERSILSVADAVSVVQTAAEVKVALAIELGESSERMKASLDLLFRISDSFAADLSPGRAGKD